MTGYSGVSESRLATCDERLQRVCRAVLPLMDHAVVCGHRGKAAQEEALKAGKSKAKWGQSPHNSYPSRAVDLAPYPIDWADRRAFDRLAGLMLGTAASLGIKLRWGGAWDGDLRRGNRRGQLEDLPHFELVD